MKHFQKIIIHLVFFTISIAFIQTDILSQSDSLVKNNSLIIGGAYKITLISGEEVSGKMQDSDSVSIKLLLHEKISTVNKVQIKSIEKLEYLLEYDTDKEVTVTTKEGFSYNGRLRTATENNISFIGNDKLSKQDSLKLNKSIFEIKKDNVKRILIHGEYYSLTGLGFGSLAGAILGTLIGYSNLDKNGFNPFSSGSKAVIGGLVGGFVGGLIGLLIGYINSTDDELILIQSGEDFNKLRKYIRKSEENNFIKTDYKKKNNK